MRAQWNRFWGLRWWIKWPIIALAAFALLLIAIPAPDDEDEVVDTPAQGAAVATTAAPAATTAPPTETRTTATHTPTPTEGPAAWGPTTFTGTGGKQTEAFNVESSPWRLCWTIERASTENAPLFINVKKEGETRTVANISPSGTTGASDCSTVRTGRGEHYLDVNTGITWSITVSSQ